MLGVGVMRALALGATTHAGDIIFTTSAAFDDRAPRDIVLTPRDAARVGLLVIAAIAAVIVSVVIAIEEPGMILGAVAFVALGAQLLQAAIRRRTTALFDAIKARAG